MCCRLLTGLFCLIILLSCNNGGGPPTADTRIVLHFTPAIRETILLEALGRGDEKRRTIDSALLDPMTDETVLQIPAQEERVFVLRIRNNPMRIFFVNDKPVIDIHARDGRDLSQYYYSGNTINIHLQDFVAQQNKLELELGQLSRKKDSLKLLGANKKTIDSMWQMIDTLHALSQNRYVGFIDTTKSAGAVLFIHNRIDFGKNYAGLRKYINHAADRFPEHKGLQFLREETLSYISLFEQEFNVGDQVPALVLPDQYDMPFSLSSLQGKFVFIDFWSTWCPQCIAYNSAKTELKKRFPASKFETLSIAMDPEIADWKKMVYQQSLPGIHIIDEKMWRGKAAAAFKIDSIPFNFLISPEGKILAKAIKKDSVVQVVSSFVK